MTADMEIDGVIDLDDNTRETILYVLDDSQLCGIACNIYKHLRKSEMNNRPSADYMENIQNDIDENMRARLINDLVKAAYNFRLVPDTIYLTVNYMDRYLSGDVLNRGALGLLGFSCMMIAAKYVRKPRHPRAEDFCNFVNGLLRRDQMLEAEGDVLRNLNYQLTAPTIQCFLTQFLLAAKKSTEVPPMQLECMANYIAELSLLNYSMLRYLPSLIAASAIFLALYFLDRKNIKWNSTLKNYTLYKCSDLHQCVRDLHRFFRNIRSHSDLRAIIEKYSLEEYQRVATMRI